MGIIYCQYAFLGISIDLEKAKEIVSPADYREELRFNPKTGEISGKERILVKQEDYQYKILGNIYPDIDDIESTNIHDLAIYRDYKSQTLFIGKSIGKNLDMGRVDLLYGSVSIDDILKDSNNIADLLKVSIEDIKIHFVGYIG